MKSLDPVGSKLEALADRFNALSLRERGLIFVACVTLVYIAWQTLLMGPVTARAHAAQQHLAEASDHLAALDKSGYAATSDPLVAAAARNHALRGRLDGLDAELKDAARSYVSPQRVTDLLGRILGQLHGLKLVSLSNLDVESLSQTVPATPRTAPDASDRGPFLHPVEIVVDGEYPALILFLRSLEELQWRVYWRQLELDAGNSPVNRVRIVIGAVSLSREWISI